MFRLAPIAARFPFVGNNVCLPVKPVNVDDAESWLNCFSPAWLRGEPEAEPLLGNAEANRQWHKAQRTQSEGREATLRKSVALVNARDEYRENPANDAIISPI